ncbi:BrnA antitoxin family protein [Burkholderia multivorans]|uniref:BrnA antitoxin family protein n=1 Tax=Burkholderia multivorans TaxID=87883 RepID=UPI001C27F7D7|nr:BrnA antitoxin family protein [Burkholderia multivorans]MBU9597930.1 BrnA antitoxin family protein [Burkholderia multivorans]MDN8000947.1 BrnA antitoxin family protein [Burkholderia multivorans]WVN01623.1 BrnA antitoxin family protein [Burkholderia multivorans]
MKAEYDFSQARRGAVVAPKGKTRITIMLDDDVLQAFRDRAARDGKGYQTLINDALREAIKADPDASQNLQHSIEQLADSLREEMQLRRREYEVCYKSVSEAAQVLGEAVTALEQTGLQTELERVRTSRTRIETVESFMGLVGTKAE